MLEWRQGDQGPLFSEMNKNKENTENNSSGTSLKIWLFDTLKSGLVGILVALFLVTFVVANSIVPTGSMEHTIEAGSRIMGLRIAYNFIEPERGDIVIFKSPNDKSVMYVKRLIGLPGDIIKFNFNKEKASYDVYINGEKLEESYLADEGIYECGEYDTYIVPENSYFFLGDNRNRSNDARFWNEHFIEKEDLVAKVYFQYWKGFKWLDSYPY